MASSSRNHEIQEIFEIADDSIQGILGYHYFTIYALKAAPKTEIKKNLPNDAIPHTFSWIRNYDKDNLIDTLTPVYDFHQSRISLISFITYFESALKSFIQNLNSAGFQQSIPSQNYKQYIKWAFAEATRCTIGDQDAISRLPTTMGFIDDARRLRNLIVHNQGFFTRFYESDAITDGIIPNFHPDYNKFQTAPDQKFPVKIQLSEFENLVRAHIEVLHVLHNSIQQHYFNYPEPYSYTEEMKSIEWSRIFLY